MTGSLCYEVFSHKAHNHSNRQTRTKKHFFAGTAGTGTIQHGPWTLTPRHITMTHTPTEDQSCFVDPDMFDCACLSTMKRQCAYVHSSLHWHIFDVHLRLVWTHASVILPGKRVFCCQERDIPEGPGTWLTDSLLSFFCGCPLTNLQCVQEEVLPSSPALACKATEEECAGRSMLKVQRSALLTSSIIHDLSQATSAEPAEVGFRQLRNTDSHRTLKALILQGYIAQGCE